jgi:hypothetical protein
MTSADTTKDSPAPTRRAEVACAALCFVLPLGLYVSTAARTVQGGDSGEFALIGVLGGVAHPPGYPLYSLLARLGAAMPTGPLFFRVALVSAISGSAAVVVIQRAALIASGSLYGSVAAALVFAVSPVLWLLSGVPEVFSLHVLLSALVVLLALTIGRSAGVTRGRELVGLGLAFGLGLSNHITLLFLAPVVAWAGWSATKKSPINLLIAAALIAAGGAIGLLPYGLLPFFARHSAPGAMVWGRTDTLSGFVDHILRRDYGTFRLATGSDASVFHWPPVASFLSLLPMQLAYVPFALAVVGTVLAIRRRMPGAIPILIAWTLAGLFFTSLFNLEMPREISLVIEERFHLLPILLLVPFAAIGIAWAVQRVPGPARWAALAGVMAILMIGNRAEANWRSETTIERYVTAAVSQTAPNAVIVGTSDTWFSAVRWVTQVLRIRPDVRYVDLNIARVPWYADQLARAIPRFPRDAVERPGWQLALALAAHDHPTYVLPSDAFKEERDRVAMEPEGFVDRIVRPGTPPRPPRDIEGDLLKATDLLDDAPATAADSHTALRVLPAALRRHAGIRWLDLASRFQAAGDRDEANRCRARAKYLNPDD